ncbi:MAG: TIGR04283 family arsenosugar biosynthesis glycosyltransferase [Methylococcales bacterium]|jgi:rSAM/selenodomain-associated transferase 2|nr:glycosyltransferase [Methylococcaceae bacterium]
MLLSIIIPTLNEAEIIINTLRPLQVLRQNCELIIVDGGSVDNTVAKASPYVDRIITSTSGRAIQMNAGAASARGDTFIFLHADSYLPKNVFTIIQQALSQGYCWGRFDIHLTGKPRLLPIISLLMNIRSRLTGIATGDQAIFITRESFTAIGQYPIIALMEDIALSKKMIPLAKPFCSRDKVISSGRRWEQYGCINTILLMWWLRLLFFLGRAPEKLNQCYQMGLFWNR